MPSRPFVVFSVILAVVVVALVLWRNNNNNNHNGQNKGAMASNSEPPSAGIPPPDNNDQGGGKSRATELSYQLYEEYAAIGRMVLDNDDKGACKRAILLGNKYRTKLTKTQFVQALAYETRLRFAPEMVATFASGYDAPIEAAMSLSRNDVCAKPLRNTFLGL